MSALLCNDNSHTNVHGSCRILVCYQRLTFVIVEGTCLTRIGFVIKVVWCGGRYAGSGAGYMGFHLM